ncbi:hypothetical protein V5799_026802 [Amblyomma americanum]|uniref:Uncharacterized protein n=1 Tax=Amblyomma americanum TaxID=6943 RepID=A0AAQ4DHJ0_AMBAM
MQSAGKSRFHLAEVTPPGAMNFKAVLIAVAIFGFQMSEAMATNAEAAAEARAEPVANERVEEVPQEAGARIDPTILGSMVGGGVR